jgi:threonylcarbamoyladenosine tRNA methylthiotransferase MtaB
LKKVALHTLGCKLNFAETSTIARDFSDVGYERVDFNEKADVYVINTCSVTNKADKKSQEAVKKARNKNPDAKVIVVGCFAQLQPGKIASIPGVDLVLGSNEKFHVTEYLDQLNMPGHKTEVHSCGLTNNLEFEPSYSAGDRTRSFLKVQDGCDYVCTYCTIPMARGKSRNANISAIVEQAKKIGDSGTREIILTGVNIGDFGKSTGDRFFDLIRELDQVESVERYRISSIELNLLTDEIIELVASSKKFMPHFHIPLQSGCNDILAKMKRRYNRELFEERVKRVKAIIPDAFIGVDVIVGFPGETNELFNTTHEFLEQLDASYYHVFSFSARPNTPAADMKGKVPAQEIKTRSKILQQLAEKKKLEFYQNNLGTSREVLFEGTAKNKKMEGFTDNYIKTEAAYNPDIAGTIKKVKLESVNESGNVVVRFIES